MNWVINQISKPAKQLTILLALTFVFTLLPDFTLAQSMIPQIDVSIGVEAVRRRFLVCYPGISTHNRTFFWCCFCNNDDKFY